jgi:aminopeptidase N
MRGGLLILFLLFSGLLQAQEVDVLHYRFHIDLTDNNDTINGKAEIRLINRTGGAVRLDLVQPSANGTGMSVIKVENGDTTAPYPFSQENNKVILPVIKGIRGDTLVFRIFYKGVPKDGLIISKNKFGERTFFADNWPNRAHQWIPCADRPDDKASAEFLVTAPALYTVVANGKKIEEQLLQHNRKLTHWKEDIPLPTKVMVFGAARFSVKTFEDSPEGTPVSAWVYPKDSAKGFNDYALAPQILQFFSQYIAPFPFGKLANVQSTTIFGGMENASAIFYAENTVTGNRSSEGLIAHEIAHQWFGDAASEKSFKHVWLSEGFATYLTHLYFEQKYGEESLRERLQNDRNKIIDFSRKNNLPVVDSSNNLMSLLNVNSYEKGAWILHMLRNVVGDTTFQKIIQTYYNQYKFTNADTKDFEAIAEKVSGKGLTWFFDQWLYRPGLPQLHIKPVIRDKKKYLLIEQKQPGLFEFNLYLKNSTGSVKTVPPQRFTITKRDTLIPIADSWTRVAIDPATTLLFEGAKLVSFQ